MAGPRINLIFSMDASEFQRNLRQVERRLGNFGKRMEDIGGTLTSRLTLPLAAVGGAALQAFAEMDKFTKGLGAVMGSTVAAEAELVKLREVAKLPGLGFQEAVQGSTNLQAVGLSADEARKTLQGFGAAIAATGGGANELFEVQRQLTQIISKNRILQEDYGVLQERVPLIGRALEQAFGTSNIEKVREMGVSGREFVSAISQALITLPQTQNLTGGLANGFENLSDSTRTALATFGEAINRSLGVEKALNALGDTLNALADGFANLSPTTQKVIVIFAAAAAAIGPVLFAIGSIAKVSAIATQGLTLLTGAFTALKAGTFVLNPIAVAIAAIGAAVFLFVQEFERYKRSIDGATAATARLANVQKTAEQNTISQRTEVNRLVEELNKDNISKQRQAEIIKELNSISPQYFGEVEKSADKYTAAKDAAKLFNDELIRGAKIQAAKEQLVELEKQLLNVEKASQPTVFQGIVNSFLSAGNVSRFAALNTNTYADNIAKATSNLEAQRDALIALISTEESKRPIVEDEPNGGGGGPEIEIKAKVNDKSINLIGNSLKQIRTLAEATLPTFDKLKISLAKIEEVRSPFDRFNESFAKFEEGLTIIDDKAKIFGTTVGDVLAQKLALARNELEKTIEVFPLGSEQVERATAAYQDAQNQFDNFTESTSRLKSMQQALAGGISQAGSIISSALEDQALSFKSMARAVLEAARAIIKAYIQEGVAGIIKNILAGPTGKALGPVAIAVAGAAGAVAASIFSAALNKIAPPRLARGGVTTGETLAVVGDNPSGKEAIIPFERMGEFLNMAGGGGTRVFGQFEVRGQDLVLVLDRAQQSKARVR